MSAPELRYYAVKFNPWDRRTYTYTWPGDDLCAGERVVVETPREGERVVTVAHRLPAPPAFACKPILRRHEAQVVNIDGVGDGE